MNRRRYFKDENNDTKILTGTTTTGAYDDIYGLVVTLTSVMDHGGQLLIGT
jgi:hypothetical protein